MTFLLLNQTFYPDVMATGQYLAEVAARLVERGHQVTVVTSRCAYDHPETQFPRLEMWRGIRIYRVASTGFGKGAKWRRAADFGSFAVACCWRLARLPRHDAVLALTTPPLISFIGAWLARFWRGLFFYWVMDFNPDEAIAAGWLRAGSRPARVLEKMSRFSLQRAHKVIALDRFMRDRIVGKGIPEGKVVVIPPWSHDDVVRYDAAGRERFRKAHGLEDKFVVMYSGNHSPVHPLETLIGAAEQLRGDKAVAFCFVGGGSEWRRIREKQKVESRKLKWEGAGELVNEEGRMKNDEGGKQKVESRKQKGEGGGAGKEKGEIAKSNAEMLKAEILKSSGGRRTEDGGQKTEDGGQRTEDRGQKTEDRGRRTESRKQETGSADFRISGFQDFSFSNVICLPYAPLEELAGSLSAADLHVVVMGNGFAGLVHPCKIYNILSVGAPILYIGPEPSHVTEILARAEGQQLWGAAAHGEVQQVVSHIQRIREAGLKRTGSEFGQLAAEFSRERWLTRLVAVMEEEGGQDG